MGISRNVVIQLGVTIVTVAMVARQRCHGYNSTFAWDTSPWSACLHRQPSAVDCCSCHQTRHVRCIFKGHPGTWPTTPIDMAAYVFPEARVADPRWVAPPFYCHKLDTQKPDSRRPCSPCQQDCVTSSWAAWSDCSATCYPASRTRLRRVLLPATDAGRSCGPLVQVEECVVLPVCLTRQEGAPYRWRVGDWSSCFKVTELTEAAEAESCGVGRRYRDVNCVDAQGQQAAKTFCQRYAGHEEHQEEGCELPCDCRLASWLTWAPCSTSCHRDTPGAPSGYQLRTRTVLRLAENGGLPCPALKEARTCLAGSLPPCPRHIWHMSVWSECYLRTKVGSGDCGSGLQTRQVTCILEGDPEARSVDDILCIQDAVATDNGSSQLRPTERRACLVPCPVDCQRGEWENWSGCSQSCGRGGVRVRGRPVVQRAQHGGRDCNKKNRSERQPCEDAPCIWWQIGQWSACLLNEYDGRDEVGEGEAGGEEGGGRCGVGSQVRSVYCLNALDLVVPDTTCSGSRGARPPEERACTVPCPGACRLTPWSPWGPCSVSCGLRGGKQSRFREVKDGDPDCVEPEGLQQTRTCGQVPCQRHLWQVSPWSPCVRGDGAGKAGVCTEPGPGTQNRSLQCQMEPGYPADESLCDPGSRPTTQRVCESPCPQDCELSAWSPWSTCSETCGPDSVKTKFRRIHLPALYGGKPCPAEADDNGIIVKTKPCRRMAPCVTSHWLTETWTQCQLHGKCGRGLQIRNVTCRRSDGRDVTDAACYEEGGGSPPPPWRPCVVPCPEDCRLSPWGPWTPCSQSCGRGNGTRTRSRSLLHQVGDASERCPHLGESDMVDREGCGGRPCPTLSWLVGRWSSCLRLSQDGLLEEDCETGYRRRHVLCGRHDSHNDSDAEPTHVPNAFCETLGPKPDTYQTCRQTCRIDCRLSPWTSWSDCSLACGEGTRSRRRIVLEESSNGGRMCDRVAEEMTCVARDCSELQWQMSEWTECKPFWGMPCGNGERSRTIFCPAGPQFDSDCDKLKPKPADTEECYVPCSADCVVSDWSDFTICDCSHDNSSQERTRVILQPPAPQGRACGPLNENRACDCPKYELVIGGWATCQLESPDADCGNGFQKRTVNCVREDKVVVSLSNCHVSNLALTKVCDVPCARDCAMGEVGEWTPCRQPCGLGAVRTRNRTVLHQANRRGRHCPRPEDLQQVAMCETLPCHNYTWKREPWSACTTAPPQCGLGTSMRAIYCERSDVSRADDIHCLRQAGVTFVRSREDLTQKELQDLDLETVSSCGKPCPSDCVVSAWSDYGPCFTNCSDPRRRPTQVRTRVSLRPASGGQDCPNNLIDSRLCAANEATCPVFSWVPGSWNKRGRRKVTCSMRGGDKVMGGCHDDEQPPRERQCTTTCGEFAECLDGRCVCETGFVAEGADCLPEFGCAHDQHCLLNHTYCDILNKECLCLDGTLPGSGLLCPELAYGATGNRGYLDDLSDLLIYILMACLLLLLLTVVIAAGCCIRRHYKPSSRPRPGLAARLKQEKKTAGATANTTTTITTTTKNHNNNNNHTAHSATTFPRAEPSPVLYKPLTGTDKDLDLGRVSQEGSPHATTRGHEWHTPSPDARWKEGEREGEEGGKAMPTATPDTRTPTTVSPASIRARRGKIDSAEFDLDQDLFQGEDDPESNDIDIDVYPVGEDYLFGQTRGGGDRRGRPQTSCPTPPPRMPHATGSLPPPARHPHPQARLPGTLPSHTPVEHAVVVPATSDSWEGVGHPDSSPSTGSNVTAIWIPPQNNLNRPRSREGRFPPAPPSNGEGSGDGRSRDVVEEAVDGEVAGLHLVGGDPLHARNLTDTPPDIYENVSSSDNNTTASDQWTPGSQPRHLASDISMETAPLLSDSSPQESPTRGRGGLGGGVAAPPTYSASPPSDRRPGEFSPVDYMIQPKTSPPQQLDAPRCSRTPTPTGAPRTPIPEVPGAVTPTRTTPEEAFIGGPMPIGEIIRRNPPTPKAYVANTPTPTASMRNTPTPTASMRNTPTPTASMRNTPTPTTSMRNTPTPTASMKNTPTPTASMRNTQTPTASMRSTPTPQSGGRNTPQETQHLLDYCDEVLADLRRVANS